MGGRTVSLSPDDVRTLLEDGGRLCESTTNRRKWVRIGRQSYGVSNDVFDELLESGDLVAAYEDEHVSRYELGEGVGL